MSAMLWEPSDTAVRSSQLTHFMAFANQTYQLKMTDYPSLHHWSVEHKEQFWQAVWSFCRIYASQAPAEIIEYGPKMTDTRWFIDAKLNFAQNLLRYRDDEMALVFTNEQAQRITLTYAELYSKVITLATYLKDLGVQVGDRVVACLPNCPETVIAMLATTALGAIWSACSSDFGLDSLVNRFAQIEPKILLAVDGHSYQGKMIYHFEKIAKLQQALPSLTHTIVVPYLSANPDLSALTACSLLNTCWQAVKTDVAFEFPQLPFNHPVYILYSSGTTGKPKCMVHGAGGTLIQHMKELRLHTNLSRQDHFFFYTTCTWMMWHWLISGLAVGARIILYEGSPVYPTANRLFDLIDQEQISVCGMGAKLIESSQNAGLTPIDTHELTHLRTLLSTGSPLLPESFDYVYQSIKTDVQLSSISGGSDIISCFALGNPNLPVYRGELQCVGLGMDVHIFNPDGNSVINEKGELVCTSPFPCMPIYFWNDPQGEQYQHAYFSQFPNIWTHGDYALLSSHGGIIIYGRSDATLKPSGVRIGTAEIYQEVESFEEIDDCVAVSQYTNAGEIIVLFVTLTPGEQLTDDLIQRVKQKIKQNASPMHVPAKIIQAPDIPKTVNGKTMEIVVKKLINGQPLGNIETIANPECLDFFRNFIH